MKKEELVLENLKKYLLSPGDIYWIKSNGDKMLISKKADICNLQLIQKLKNAGMELDIENSIESHLLNESSELLKKFEEELLFTKKIEWRNLFFRFLNENFIYSSREQLDLNLIMWGAFSLIEFQDAQLLIERDRDFFDRSWTMATTATLFAMLYGQYEIKSLRELFSNTILNQFKVLGKRTGLAFKESFELYQKDLIDLEEIKNKFEIDNENIFFIESVKDGKLTNQYTAIERILIFLNESMPLVMNENVLVKLLKDEINIENRYRVQFGKYFRFREVLESNVG